MAHYVYRCPYCKHTQEVQHRITEEPVVNCEKCWEPARRVVQPAGIVFKGNGFHVNDYPRR